eukprot:3885568-Rhodomonas_salina.1
MAQRSHHIGSTLVSDWLNARILLVQRSYLIAGVWSTVPDIPRPHTSPECWVPFLPTRLDVRY